MRLVRGAIVVAALSVLLAATSGCSSSSKTPRASSPARAASASPRPTGPDPFATRPHDGTALTTAMDEVSGAGPAATYFEFGNNAGLRELGVVDPAAVTSPTAGIGDQRWIETAGTGLSGLGFNFRALPAVIGVNPWVAGAAIAIGGNPPDVAVRLDGPLDAGTIDGKLTKLGARPHTFGSVAGLSFGADDSIRYSGPITTQLQLQNQLDQVVVSGHGFAASPNAASLRSVLGGGPSLLRNRDNRQLAGCLGNAIVAAVDHGHPDSEITGYGVGMTAPAAMEGPLQEVLCVDPRAGHQAAVRTALAARLALSARDPYHGVPMSYIIANSAVADVGELVRVTVTIRPGDYPWLMDATLTNHEERYWDGSCSAAAMAQSQC